MIDMKVLVVYYSRSGITKKVADNVTDVLSCDKEEIKDNVKRTGPLGFIRSGREAMAKKIPEISDFKNDVSLYDLIVIGTPVWAGKMASPVRSFIENYKEKFRDVAFFATGGGDNDQGIFLDMEEAVTKKPLTTLYLRTKEVKNEDISKPVKVFCSSLK